MKTESFNAHSKHMILKHALKVNNVALTCKLFGISRTTFYNWHRSYEKYGMLGLKNKEPQKPKMPNKVSRSIENEILTYVEKNPTDGPKRIYYELKSEGINVGESGIYNVLRRNNLSKKQQRIQYSKNKFLFSIPRKKSKKTTSISFPREEETFPLQYVVQRIDFMGRYEGIGKVYQYSLYDYNSRLGVIKLYNRKKDIDIWYFFGIKIMYLLKTFNLKIEHLVTQKTKEFIPYFIKSNKLNEITKDLNIDHIFLEDEKNPLVQASNQFNEYLIKGFYNKIGKEIKIDNFGRLERELLKYLRYHNFTKPIKNGPNTGRIPAEIILEKAAQNNFDFDALPLWLLALLNQPKGVDLDE